VSARRCSEASFSLARDVAGLLVGAEADEARVAKLAVLRPLHESDLDDDLGRDPVHVFARKIAGARERRSRDFERVEATTELGEELGIETGPDLAGVDEVVSFEVADEQRARVRAAQT